MSNVSFANTVFHLFRELSAIFIKFEIVVCKLFQDQSELLSFRKGLTLYNLMSLSTSKAFPNDEYWDRIMTQFVLDRVENTMEKEKILVRGFLFLCLNVF